MQSERLRYELCGQTLDDDDGCVRHKKGWHCADCVEYEKEKKRKEDVDWALAHGSEPLAVQLAYACAYADDSRTEIPIKKTGCPPFHCRAFPLSP